MAQKLKFGNGTWATKEGSTLAYNDENNNYKPLPFTTTRDSIATRVNKEGLIEVVDNDIPRIDYTDSTEGALLLEPSRSNLVTYSEAFSNSYWAKSNASVVSGFTSPDGTTNAFKLVENSNNSSHILYKNNITTGSGKTTLSIKAKAGERKWILLGDFEQGNRVYFDLENGVAGTVLGSPNSYSITALQNGWYDITLTTTATTKIDFQVYLATGNNQEIYQGDGTSGVYIYGAQLEEGSYPTSYIPTNGASATRLADTASGSGNSEVFNDSEGVLFLNTTALSNDGTSRRISISDETNTNRVFFSYTTTSNSIRMYVVAGGSNVVDRIVSISDTTNFNKIILKYKQNDFSLWVNGFEVSTDTNGISFPTNTLKNLSFNGAAGGQNFYGKTKQIGYYDTVLTDEELETLTSYRSLNELVTELNLNTL